MNYISNIYNYMRNIVTGSKISVETTNLSSDITFNNIVFVDELFNSKNSIIYSDIDNKYILKKYKIHNIKKKYIQDEICILKQISKYKKKNIVNFLDATDIEHTSNYYLMFEYFGIDLFEYLTNQSTSSSSTILDLSNITYIIRTLFETISFIHSLKIAHCDIKKENILIKDGVIKLCDFGFATYMDNNSKIYNKRGTLEYISPELHNKEKADGRLNDLWSLGILICKIITYTHPYINTISNIIGYNNTFMSSSKSPQFIYKEDPLFWDLYNKSMDSLIEKEDMSKSIGFLYKYNLRKLLNILLIKDELVKYSKIIEYADFRDMEYCDTSKDLDTSVDTSKALDTSVDTSKDLDTSVDTSKALDTSPNINLCYILLTKHDFFNRTYV